MWSKFDDQFYLNPKNCLMDRDEQDLYFASIIYCNGQLTDGFIPGGVLQMLCIWAKIPIEASAKAIAGHLIEHNFWEICAGGYQVHNFLDWNLSKEQVTELRQARSDAGKRGGNKSQARRQAIAKANAKQKSTLSPYHVPEPVPEPEPVPDSARDEFDKMQHIIERIANMTPDNAAPKAINELITMQATEADIRAGHAWLIDNKKRCTYYGQLVGPTRTAMSMRVGKNRGTQVNPDDPAFRASYAIGIPQYDDDPETPATEA